MNVSDFPGYTPITMTDLRKRTYELVERAAAGEFFIITKYGVPQVIMRPLTEAERAESEKEEGSEHPVTPTDRTRS